MAKAGGGLPDDLISVRVLPGWQTKTGNRMSGLHLSLAPGWKTYWRSPGDAGIPPQFSWRGSKNLKGVKVHWPSPSVYNTNGMRTVGYSRNVVLPLTVVPRDPSQPVRLKGRIDVGVCEVVCVPMTLKLDTQLDGKGQSDLNIHQALATLPVPADRAGVSRVVCAISPTRDGIKLSAQITMPQISPSEVVLVETHDPRIWVAEPKARRKGDVLYTETELVPPAGEALALNRDRLRFTVIGTSQAVDIAGCAAG
ncbi:protein-disulfide reductase DsbD domain-containing protein [Actibacterium sp. 188UL27-1]|uniref:protein-disulfide reductase DsbD domain-containing protein n=1 Tax=Actibacterium sp. 188UL27-1 TaxID=2786961 RepID=UPI00195BE3C8|nr:protein-disulfide reductase DsbD domain-containing protein [Actibacterium sp. 188UL27-1]MBM7068517.1 hypothetical protein [Actibacterium sp. 188UL27-1]